MHPLTLRQDFIGQNLIYLNKNLKYFARRLIYAIILVKMLAKFQSVLYRILCSSQTFAKPIRRAKYFQFLFIKCAISSIWKGLNTLFNYT